MLLENPPHQQIKLLVSTTELHISFKRYGVVALNQRIQELMNSNWLLSSVTLGEIITLEHPCNRILTRELDHARGIHLAHPFGIEYNPGFLRVQNLEHLLFIGNGVLAHLLFC